MPALQRKIAYECPEQREALLTEIPISAKECGGDGEYGSTGVIRAGIAAAL